MKKLVSLILAVTLLLGLMGSAAIADEKPTLRLITMLHTEQTAAIEDLYIFKYIEKYFNVNYTRPHEHVSYRQLKELDGYKVYEVKDINS